MTWLRRTATLKQVHSRWTGRGLRWLPPPKNWDPQFGNYPRLPWIPFDQRDPNVHWDDPVHRRNFGETIPEEFDVQDAWFQGDHDPVDGWWKGMQGQAALAAIGLGLLGLTWLSFDPSWKPPKKELPPQVQHYLDTAGLDKIRTRPYEPCVVSETWHMVSMPKPSSTAEAHR